MQVKLDRITYHQDERRLISAPAQGVRCMARLGPMLRTVAGSRWTSEFLTWLALKSLNRSLKSELTNIAALDPVCVRDQLPSGVKARLGWLVLPELQIK